MLRRNILPSLLEALDDTPVVFLGGPRQSGKTTLAKSIARDHRPARYLTLDDAAVMAAAGRDPTGFLAGIEGPVVLDEVQRIPALFSALKAAVDRDRRPGRFLLTGSADVLLLPRMAGWLTGRLELFTLWPFSQGELEGREDRFIDAVFSEPAPRMEGTAVSRLELIERAMSGGYPEVQARTSRKRREAWYRSYVTTLLQREVRELANVEDLSAIPRLLSLLAVHSTTLANATELSRRSGIPLTTLRRYLALLEATFLVQGLPAWSSNRGKRLVKSPRLYLNDTGLLAHVLGLDVDRLGSQGSESGPFLENFVLMELRKQAGWSETSVGFFHFRTHAGQEVDIVLEDPAARVVGVEVKAAATVTRADLRGLESLAEMAGNRFHRGLVLYAGTEVIPFGARLHALPMSALWQLRAIAPVSDAVYQRRT